MLGLCRKQREEHNCSQFVKLIFDQNISFRVVPKVLDFLPYAVHVRSLDLEDTEDGTIWQFAKQNEDAIITFDQDFAELAMVRGAPPKIIWLRIGNSSNDEIIEFLKNNLILIEEFLKNKNYMDLDYLELK